jgi:hypothetical protein
VIPGGNPGGSLDGGGQVTPTLIDYEVTSVAYPTTGLKITFYDTVNGLSPAFAASLIEVEVKYGMSAVSWAALAGDGLSIQTTGTPFSALSGPGDIKVSIDHPEIVSTEKTVYVSNAALDFISTVTANGMEGSGATTALTITLDGGFNFTDLEASHFTITTEKGGAATKGALTGGASGVYTLAVTVVTAGTVKVSVSKIPDVYDAGKTVRLKSGTPITYSITGANGTVKNTDPTTEVYLKFDTSIDGLAGTAALVHGDFAVEGDGGETFTISALTETGTDGKEWKLVGLWSDDDTGVTCTAASLKGIDDTPVKDVALTVYGS